MCHQKQTLQPRASKQDKASKTKHTGFCLIESTQEAQAKKDTNKDTNKQTNKQTRVADDQVSKQEHSNSLSTCWFFTWT